MPIQQYPKFKAVPDKMLDIPNPAMGGINLRDLEYEQEVNQSPYMLNVMYRNGAFGKRFGQEVHSTYANTVYACVYFGGNIYVHSGTKIYRNAGGTITDVSGLITFPQSKGIFIVYAQKLYYLVSNGFYILDSVFKTINAYIPDLFINCKPDGTHSDGVDEFNLMSDYFSLIYNGDGTSDHYKVGEYDPNDIIDWSENDSHLHPQITIEVNDTPVTEVTDYTVDASNKQIIFTSPPADGDLNVKMTFKMVDGTFSTERGQILSCKFYDTFGGANNSRLFIAGCGYSKYFYTASYDISYFPESNFATLGNTEEDITGFGRQYNVLIVFKPREVYSIYSYTETSSTTVIEENIGLEAFKSQLVNAQIGCDAPYSIQLVNNLLTWYNSSVGICTLTSTNIQDERNVRTISRNIDFTNNFGVKGVLDYNEDLTKIQSVDYENKYFLVFPTSGMCFMWDYEIQPYVVTSRGETDPRKLCWFLFDRFNATQFLKVGRELLFVGKYAGENASAKNIFPKYGTIVKPGGIMQPWGEINSTSYQYSGDVLQITIPSSANNGGLWQEIQKEEGKYYTLYMEVKNTSAYDVNINCTVTGGYVVDSVTVDGNSNSFVPVIINTNGTEFEINSFTTDSASRYIEVQNVMIFETSIPVGDEYILNAITGYTDEGDSITVNYSNFTNKLIKLNSLFEDLDYSGDGHPDPIHSYFQTPFMQFGAVEMLKNVNNLYVQCRGDVSSLINLYYYTNDSAKGEPELDPISTGGKGSMWNNFQWGSFHWFINSWGNTLRRKCNLKKIQMASVYFENNELDKDMSITHIGMQYQLVKYIK